MRKRAAYFIVFNLKALRMFERQAKKGSMSFYGRVLPQATVSIKFKLATTEGPGQLAVDTINGISIGSILKDEEEDKVKRQYPKRKDPDAQALQK